MRRKYSKKKILKEMQDFNKKEQYDFLRKIIGRCKNTKTENWVQTQISYLEHDIIGN